MIPRALVLTWAFVTAALCLGMAAGAPIGDAPNLVIARTAPTDSLVSGLIAAFHVQFPQYSAGQTASTTDLPARALAELLDSSVSIAPFVRELQPTELQSAQALLKGGLVYIPLASGSYATPSNSHAIAIYVNQANPLRHLSLTELDAIYSITRMRGGPKPLRTWGDLGLTGAWANQPIHRYGMVIERKTGNPHSGIVSYLMDRVFKGGSFDPSVIQVPDTGMGRGNNRALDEIADAVAKDPLAIGYSGFANARPAIRALALSETAESVPYDGTIETVRERTYPLTRTIYLLARRGPDGSLDPAVRAFLMFALSQQGQAVIERDAAGFLPLPRPMAESIQSQLVKPATGPA